MKLVHQLEDIPILTIVTNLRNFGNSREIRGGEPLIFTFHLWANMIHSLFAFIVKNHNRGVVSLVDKKGK